MDGVVRVPSAFSSTLTLPPSIMATQELVVPRSIPMIFAMNYLQKRQNQNQNAPPSRHQKLEAYIGPGAANSRAPVIAAHRVAARASGVLINLLRTALRHHHHGRA